MRKFQKTVYLTVLIFFGCNPQPTEVPEQYARVNDYANMLTDPEETKLNKLLKSLEDSVGSQLAILSVDSLGEKSIEQYAMEIAEAWQPGRAGYNDGIVLVLAIKDRRIRMDIGCGLQGIIDDELANEIIESLIVPEFRAANFYSGLRKGSEKIIQLIFEEAEHIGEGCG